MIDLYKKYRFLSVAKLNSAFTSECAAGNLANVKYLLTGRELKKHANIRAMNQEGFKMACYYGHLDVVKYLLTSPELKEHSNPRWSESEALRNACIQNQVHIVEYLLNFPVEEKRPDVHAKNDRAFNFACEYESMDVVRYFIFNFNIPKTRHIEKYLKAYPNEKIEGWFKIRDLNEKLNGELSSDKLNTKNKPKL